MTDIGELRRLAKEALDEFGEDEWYAPDEVEHIAETDWRYIAAVSPSAVLGLIVALEKVAAVVDHLDRFDDDVHSRAVANDLREAIGEARTDD